MSVRIQKQYTFPGFVSTTSMLNPTKLGDNYSASDKIFPCLTIPAKSAEIKTRTVLPELTPFLPILHKQDKAAQKNIHFFNNINE
jgi:hypothetical protein